MRKSFFAFQFQVGLPECRFLPSSSIISKHPKHKHSVTLDLHFKSNIMCGVCRWITIVLELIQEKTRSTITWFPIDFLFTHCSKWNSVNSQPFLVKVSQLFMVKSQFCWWIPHFSWLKHTIFTSWSAQTDGRLPDALSPVQALVLEADAKKSVGNYFQITCMI